MIGTGEIDGRTSHKAGYPCHMMELRWSLGGYFEKCVSSCMLTLTEIPEFYLGKIARGDDRLAHCDFMKTCLGGVE